jgi:homoserine kinase
MEAETQENRKTASPPLPEYLVEAEAHSAISGSGPTAYLLIEASKARSIELGYHGIRCLSYFAMTCTANMCTQSQWIFGVLKYK